MGATVAAAHNGVAHGAEDVQRTCVAPSTVAAIADVSTTTPVSEDTGGAASAAHLFNGCISEAGCRSCLVDDGTFGTGAAVEVECYSYPQMEGNDALEDLMYPVEEQLEHFSLSQQAKSIGNGNADSTTPRLLGRSTWADQTRKLRDAAKHAISVAVSRYGIDDQSISAEAGPRRIGAGACCESPSWDALGVELRLKQQPDAFLVNEIYSNAQLTGEYDLATNYVTKFTTACDFDADESHFNKNEAEASWTLGPDTTLRVCDGRHVIGDAAVEYSTNLDPAQATKFFLDEDNWRAPEEPQKCEAIQVAPELDDDEEQAHQDVRGPSRICRVCNVLARCAKSL